ncbi:MAG: GNAT family N-acetyltransferase [Anaerolineae bacterium]|nr:GNAT family N-acetyltransferase [Anaerolineae bacterium]
MTEYTLRLTQPEDASALLEYMGPIADEPNNGISLASSDEITYTEEGLRKQIESQLQADNRLSIVAIDQEGSIIGYLNCDPPGPRGYLHTVSVGITVRRDWRDKGVGSAMMRYALDWCESNATIKRVELDVFTNNPRAIHVYEKFGFIQEGVRRSVYYKHGEFLDLLHMGIVYEGDI